MTDIVERLRAFGRSEELADLLDRQNTRVPFSQREAVEAGQSAAMDAIAEIEQLRRPTWLRAELAACKANAEKYLESSAAAYRAALEQAAQLVELEYAPDKKAHDRLKQIASHIRALPVDA